MTGVNVDPLNEYGAPSSKQLLRAGFRWVRLVSRPGVEQYVEDMQQAGLMVLAVITEQSGGYICPADVIQCGNEPDLPGTGDSMTAGKYADYFKLYRDTYPDLVMIGAGLASGQPNYWSSVVGALGSAIKGMSGLAVHPYNKTASQAKVLLSYYQKSAPTMPVWITEWNRPDAEIPVFTTMLRQNTAMHAWYCWDNGMTDGFGLGPRAARILGASA